METDTHNWIFKKYEKMGWEFENGFADPRIWFKSPRMLKKEMFFKMLQFNEDNLLEIEPQFYREQMWQKYKNNIKRAFEYEIENKDLKSGRVKIEIFL